MIEKAKNKKTLIVYYSYSGNTKYIAEMMAEIISADSVELVPKKKMNVSGLGMLGWGVRQLFRKDGRELEPIHCNVADYDLVIIGTPVWTYTLTPPVRTFLKEQNFEGKNVAIFCCHDGNKAHTLEDMIAGMPGSNCIGQIDFMSVLTHDRDGAAREAKKWVRTLVKSL